MNDNISLYEYEPICAEELSRPSTKKFVVLVGLNICVVNCDCWGNTKGGVPVFISKLPSKSKRSLLFILVVGGGGFLVVTVGIVIPTSVLPSKSKSALFKKEIIFLSVIY